MSDRHEKWVRVEPGHVIPAGQPYRMEFAEDGFQKVTATATEYVATEDRGIGNGAAMWFVDSSWRPPLDLPTEPTWGIAVVRETDHLCNTSYEDWILDLWSVKSHQFRSEPSLIGKHTSNGYALDGTVLDFVPLTPEQVARIEAAR